MKRTLILLILLTAPLFPVTAQSSLSAEAQRAYMTGDLKTAREKFQLILAADPQNVVAKHHLRMIAVNEAKANASGASLQTKLRLLILPKVEFGNATLDSALEALRQQATKVSGGKVAATFVIQPGVDASKPVTLHLENIPFLEALRYIGNLANVEFAVEQYAIVVKPIGGAIPSPSATSR